MQYNIYQVQLKIRKTFLAWPPVERLLNRPSAGTPRLVRKWPREFLFRLPCSTESPRGLILNSLTPSARPQKSPFHYPRAAHLQR